MIQEGVKMTSEPIKMIRKVACRSSCALIHKVTVFCMVKPQGAKQGALRYPWGNPVHVCVPGISPAGLNN